MNKLFTLREWLTLPEAVKHISTLCNEEVSTADIFRLALDGKIRLSMNFVNYASVRKGKIARYSEEEIDAAISSGKYPEDLNWSDIGAQVLAMQTGVPCGDNPPLMVTSIRIGEDLYLTLEKDVTTISGVWDIPLLGGDRLDIEHAYQMLTQGPEITLSNLDGAFVGSLEEGIVCQIQESNDENEYIDGSKAQLRAIEESIKEQNIEPEFAERLRKQHAEKRKVFLEKRDKKNRSNNYYPAPGLPDDAVLVVRKKELVNFEKSLQGDTEKDSRPLSTTERNTLLIVIASLSKRLGLDVRSRGAAGELVRMADDLGISLSDDTARSILKQVPDAVAARQR